MRMKKRFLGILLSLALVLGLMPGMSLTAYAASKSMAVSTVFTKGDTIQCGDDEVYFYALAGTDTAVKCKMTGNPIINAAKYWYTNFQVGLTQQYTIVSSGQQGYSFYLRNYEPETDQSDLNAFKVVGGTGTSDNPFTLQAIVIVASVTLNPSTAQTIDVGNSVSFTASVAPDGVTDKTVKWSVTGSSVTLYSDEDCTTAVGTDATETLTVYAKGISAGTATVTCTSNANSSKKASCNVTVNAAHTHSFTYSTSGAIITATCTADGCTLTDSKSTLAIVAPTLTTYGETGKSASATLTGLEAFNTATGKTIAATAIKYVGRDGTTYAESATASTDAGKYTANITLTGVKTSEGDNKSVTASVNYEIAKADPTATAPTLAATYGQTLADVTLTNPEGNTPGSWAWALEGTTSVGNAGSNTFKANFTPTDTANYNSVSNVDVTVTVGKADPTATAPTATATYGQTLADVTLTNPEGNTPGSWAWVDEGTTSVGNAGSNTFKANFTPTDTANYNSVSNVDVTVTIEPTVTFTGGSLRRRVITGTEDVVNYCTDMRLEFKFELPEGAVINEGSSYFSCSTRSGTVPIAHFYNNSCALVICNIPKEAYGFEITAEVNISYTLNGESTSMSATGKYSVNQICDKLKGLDNLTWVNYAKYLLGEVDSYTIS